MNENNMDANATANWMLRAAAVIAEREKELTALDRAIGDGDHGANLHRGFSAVASKLEAGEYPATPAEVFKLTATTLISTVGGASGPLFGTAFLKGSIAVAGQDVLSEVAVAAFLQAAAVGVQSRGKAEAGDKTMVDAWLPAAAAAEKAAGHGASLEEVLRSAASAAQQGAVDTEPLIARKGRASYLGERAIGHRDPGAESTALILAAAKE